MKIELDSYSSFFYIALTFLISRRNETIPPEVLYLMDPDQVLQLCDTFGGSKIYVPTRKELSVELKAVLVLYYRYCKGFTDFSIREKLDIAGKEMSSINSKIKKYLEYIETEGLIPPSIMKDLTDVRRK